MARAEAVRLSLAGALAVVFGLALRPLAPGGVPLAIPGALVAVLGLMPLALGLSRLLHLRAGQERLREAVLADLALTGTETLVELAPPDAAPGEGVAALAAPLLAGGRSVAAQPGAIALPDGSADRVVAIRALGALDTAGRLLAVREIARVLARGGRVEIADWARGREIAAALAAAGLEVDPPRSATRAALTPMWRLCARPTGPGGPGAHRSRPDGTAEGMRAAPRP